MRGGPKKRHAFLQRSLHCTPGMTRHQSKCHLGLALRNIACHGVNDRFQPLPAFGTPSDIQRVCPWFRTLLAESPSRSLNGCHPVS